MPTYLKLGFVFLFVVLLQSCVSTQAHWKNKVYQPKKTGVLFYNLRTNIFNQDALIQRKQDARMKMLTFCEPKKPQIISERQAEEVIGSQSHVDGYPYFSNFFTLANTSSTSYNIVRNRVYINFSCE